MSVIIPANFFPNSPTLIAPLEPSWKNNTNKQKIAYTHATGNPFVELGFTITMADLVSDKAEAIDGPDPGPGAYILLRRAFTAYLRANIPELIKGEAYVCHRFSEARKVAIESPMGDAFVVEKFAVVEEPNHDLPYLIVVTGIAPLIDDYSVQIVSDLVSKVDFS